MKIIFISLTLFLFSFSANAYFVSEKNWGIAGGFRSAKIPYPAKEDRVDDFIPLMFYEGDTFFIRGLTGGAKLYNKEAWQFSLIGRYRFFDIPAEYQNLAQGNALDVGGQLKYRVNDNFETNFEIMTDDESRFYSVINGQYHWETGSWELLPFATLRLKSADFNNHYFGLDGASDPTDPSKVFHNKIGNGYDLTVGTEVRYHVVSNLYLLGRAQLTTLDSNTRDSITIENGTYGEAYLGVAFFNDKTEKKVSSLKAKPYIRVAHGWATPSNLNSILRLDAVDDEQNNQLTSVFYGHPIADSLFGVEAFDIYITTGFVYHHGSSSYSQTLSPGEGINTPELGKVGANLCDGESPCTLRYKRQPTKEYVLGIKAYYNIHWPVHWRLGVAEGLSYVKTVTNIEQREMDKKGYRSSKLMNYVDITADVSLGDAFGVNEINDLYFGLGIHHRSSIFESSSAFGRIKGGSNYISAYLQHHF